VVRGQAGSHAVAVGTVVGAVELRLLEDGWCEGNNPEGLDSLDRPVLVAAENLVAAAREHVVGVAGMPGAVLLEVVAAATADGSAVGIAVVDIEAVCGDVVAGVWVDECEELGTGGVRTVAVPVVRALAGDILAVDVHVADVAVVASQDGDVGSVDLAKEPEDLWLPLARMTGIVSVSGHRRVGGSGHESAAQHL